MRTLHFALIAAISFFALVCASSGDAAETAAEQTLLRTFNVLRSVGEASNTGRGEDEALRQACVSLQEQGTLALNEGLDKLFYDRLTSSTASLFDFSSIISSQSKSGLSAALGAGCAALTGDGNGPGGSLLDANRLKSMGVTLALDQGTAVVKDLALSTSIVKRVELETGYEDGEFLWEALTVVPLWEDELGQDHIFTQWSWNHGTEGGDTLNAGLAWRRLSEDKAYVYGINAFFDHALRMNHNRMSVGADLQTSMLGVSTNRYLPLSDWKSLDAYEEERAASGWDLELQGRLPDFPAWQANVRGYRWSSDNEGDSEDVFGYDASLQWMPVNILMVEAGLRDEQDAPADFHAALRLVYRFGDEIGRASEAPHRLASMEERVYDKVRRENKIRTERRVKDEAYVTVEETVGANVATIADGSTLSLRAGLELPRPFTVSIAAAGASVARLRFRDGAILTVGAGSQVRVEASVITLIAGVFQYVSGSTNVIINVPGGTVTLLGTDVDVSSDGTTSVLRVRDGQARLDGDVAGSAVLNPGELAESVSGTVGVLAANAPDAIAHTDEVSEAIDRAASPLSGEKVAPYPVEEPRLTATATLPGQSITIGLRFNDALTVAGGTPRLLLDVNGNARFALLSGGAGTDDLAFSYTLQAGDAGATSVTVQSLDLNGATLTGNGGKEAVATIADTVLNLGGSITDITAPSGYAVAFTTDPVTASNQSAASFQITDAEIGATYNYTISSSGGGTPLTGTGAIATATQNFTGIDVSSLPDGTLTLSLTLTDTASNIGAAATDGVIKDIITLALNFVTGAYQMNGTTYGSPAAIPGWTFSRAAPATTYAEDSAGNLVAFAANQPRITDKGLLVEGSRTNSITYSEFTDSVWTTSTAFGQITSNVTLNANSITAPNGALTGYKLVLDNGQSGNPNTAKLFRYLGGIASSSPWTSSIYIKDAGIDKVRLYLGNAQGNPEPAIATGVEYTFSTNTAILIPGNTGATATVSQQILSNGWVRVSVHRPDGCQCAGTSGWWLTFTSAVTGDGTSGVYIWGAQVEQASFASSYIPTAGASVTRDSDIAKLLTSGWFNTVQGTFVNQASILGEPGTPIPNVSLSIGTADNSSFGELFSSDGRTNIGFLNPAFAFTAAYLDMTGKSFKAAGAYSSNYTVRQGVLDGVLGTWGMVSAGDIIANPVTHIGIGATVRNPTVHNFLHGYVQDIKYYPSAKSNAELQTLTQ